MVLTNLYVRRCIPCVMVWWNTFHTPVHSVSFLMDKAFCLMDKAFASWIMNE